MTDQGSNKTGFVRDDELKREMQDALRSTRPVRSEEPLEPQSVQDELVTGLVAVPSPGAPSGMTPEDVIVRSDLARHLEPSIFPARRSALLGSLHRHQAPDALLDRVSDLPSGTEYRNVQAVVQAMGFGVEENPQRGG
ncbi:DUF2795 domain-containing protein [Streptomyces sp. NPDC020917]|uniref:DUF2795 domain-containing protein n=1 Tax=Streptomyces sp. NPDC020917 TaxID=3365102 RepID=UPI0037B585FD